MGAPGGDSLAELLARGRIPGGLVRQAVWRAEVASTQAEARRLASRCGAGVLVVADRQTGGRGRQGRFWFSPPGGLWMSLILSPARPRREWPLLTPIAALALRDALEAVASLSCGIKWPNDLLVGERKIAGILAETGCEPYLVLGMGVNLSLGAEDFPPDLRAAATSVRIETGRPLARRRLLPELLRRLAAHIAAWERCGPAVLRGPLERASLLLGRDVTIATAPADSGAASAQGGARAPGSPAADPRLDVAAPCSGEFPACGHLCGRVVGLGVLGELIVETAGGERVSAAAGEIVAVRPPLGAAARPLQLGEE